MSILVGAPPESDFNQPLRLLSDCHRRIERFLDQLLQVTEQAQGGTLSPEQHEALDVALRYFQKATELHTADEEDSLFPLLRANDCPEAAMVLEMMDALEADHQMIEAEHARVERLGQRWLAEGTLSAHQAHRLILLLRNLREIYRWHIAIEDKLVFPVAQRALDAPEIAVLGRAMAQRRGIDPDAPFSVSRCAARRGAQQTV